MVWPAARLPVWMDLDVVYVSGVPEDRSKASDSTPTGARGQRHQPAPRPITCRRHTDCIEDPELPRSRYALWLPLKGYGIRQAIGVSVKSG